MDIEIEGRLEELVGAARAAADLAYSPYSGVCVGAALLGVAESGSSAEIFTGCNVENASYGLTLCAERAALARAISEGQRDFAALAVWSSTPRPLMPCGACRQVLHEFTPSMRVLIAGADASAAVYTLSDLLPDAVGPGDLGA